jgi:hypothetical protein
MRRWGLPAISLALHAVSTFDNQVREHLPSEGL